MAKKPKRGLRPGGPGTGKSGVEANAHLARDYPVRRRRTPAIYACALDEHEQPNGRKVRVERATGKHRCGAKLRTRHSGPCPCGCGGELCPNAPMMNGRCKSHGGENVGRLMTSGRYSMHMKAWQDKYGLALASHNIFDLRPTLAMMDVLIGRLIERAERDGDTPEYRAVAKELYEDVTEAMKDGGTGKIATAFKALGNHLAVGRGQDESLAELIGLLERRSRRTEAAIHAHARSEDAVNARELTAVLGLFIAIIESEMHGYEHVDFKTRSVVPAGAITARLVGAFNQQVLGRGMRSSEHLQIDGGGPDAPIPDVQGQGGGP